MDAYIDETGKIIPTLIRQTELACNYGHLGYQNHALCRNKPSITTEHKVESDLVLNQDSDKVPVTFDDNFTDEYDALVSSSGSGDGNMTYADVIAVSF